MTLIEKLIEMENSKLIDEKGNYIMITLEEHEKKLLEKKLQDSTWGVDFLTHLIETKHNLRKENAELKAENEKLLEKDIWHYVSCAEDEEGNEIVKYVKYKYIKRIRE